MWKEKDPELTYMIKLVDKDNVKIAIVNIVYIIKKEL